MNIPPGMMAFSLLVYHTRLMSFWMYARSSAVSESMAHAPCHNHTLQSLFHFKVLQRMKLETKAHKATCPAPVPTLNPLLTTPVLVHDLELIKTDLETHSAIHNGAAFVLVQLDKFKDKSLKQKSVRRSLKVGKRPAEGHFQRTCDDSDFHREARDTNWLLSHLWKHKKANMPGLTVGGVTLPCRACEGILFDSLQDNMKKMVSYCICLCQVPGKPEP